VTKNLPPAEAVATIGELLGRDFGRAHLFTLAGDWQLRCLAGDNDRLKAARPAFTQLPSPEHDRRKVKPASRKFLEALGVVRPDGEPRPGMADKLRQIDRFTELLGHLVEDSPLRDRREVRVVDMGAGKGYLTFATCEFFRTRGVAADVIGVERRADLVELANGVARECGVGGVRFIQGAFGETPIGECDVLIALHACDTATDDALHQGLRAGAALLVTAPCCHKEVRPQLKPPPVLRDVLKHGILREREAEIITDALRALLLEIHGCKANVFEFISPEHTSRNLMIAAHRRARPLDPEPQRARLRELLEFHGIREQRLARLLGEL
jgi:SAM-dependent methyltransferase